MNTVVRKYLSLVTNSTEQTDKKNALTWLFQMFCSYFTKQTFPKEYYQGYNFPADIQPLELTEGEVTETVACLIDYLHEINKIDDEHIKIKIINAIGQTTITTGFMPLYDFFMESYHQFSEQIIYIYIRTIAKLLFVPPGSKIPVGLKNNLTENTPADLLKKVSHELEIELRFDSFYLTLLVSRALDKENEEQKRNRGLYQKTMLKEIIGLVKSGEKREVYDGFDALAQLYSISAQRTSDEIRYYYNYKLLVPWRYLLVELNHDDRKSIFKIIIEMLWDSEEFFDNKHGILAFESYADYKYALSLFLPYFVKKVQGWNPTKQYSSLDTFWHYLMPVVRAKEAAVVKIIEENNPMPVLRKLQESEDEDVSHLATEIIGFITNS